MSKTQNPNAVKPVKPNPATKAVAVAPAKNDKPEKGPVVRIHFKESPIFSEFARGIYFNESGLLKTVPQMFHKVDAPDGFNPRAHSPLRRADFVEEADFMLFRAQLLEHNAQAAIAKAARLRRDADAQRKFGDPKSRAKVKRLQRLFSQLSELKATLAADGIEFELDELMDEATDGGEE